MPELPEVETTRRGLAPHVEGRRIRAVTLRRPDLRWPIPPEVARDLPGQRIQAVRRRAKYLLMDTEAGSALLHLGMSGSLRVLPATTPVTAHDHVDIALAGERGHAGRVLRFNDPRRFGCLLWQAPGQTHPLLQGLGPEPLSDAFDGDYLFAMSRGRKAPVKTFLVDQAVVVGVGNIYAAESLFRAGISPLRAAGKVSRDRYVALAAAVKDILAYAITRGGTTLRDFSAANGMEGHFQLQAKVYGRDGQPCTHCASPILLMKQGQRSTYYCARCQK